MKKKLFITFGILLVLILTSAVAIAVSFMNAPKHPSDYHIGITYEEAVAASERPMLALFYADWCGYCLRFMPKYNILSKLYKNKYNFVMVNVEDPENRKLIEDVGIAGYPTVYILDPKYDNRVLMPNLIYQDLAKFRVELDRYLRIRGLLDKASEK